MAATEPARARPESDGTERTGAASVSTPIVVLGMHRSGTSALAKVLGRLGVWMGSEPNVSRRTEHIPGQECNQSLLNDHGGHWSAPPDLAADWLTDAASTALLPQARAAVADLELEPRFAWKDPRTCITLPYWRMLFAGEPIAVISYRHPLEVAASLLKRNSFQPGHAHALWERYNRSLLNAATGLRTIVVAYADLAVDPVRTLAAVHESLASFGIVLPGDPAHAADGIEPDRRHHVFDELPDVTVTQQQRDLWDALRSLPKISTSFVAPRLSVPHAASTELLAQRALTIRLEREHQELQRRLRSRRALATTFVRRLRTSES